MKTKLKIVFFFLSLFLFGVGVAMSQPPAYFVHYASEDGLPQHTVTDILQDRKGFMWFSTWAGLSKFDGYTFTTYHLPSGEFESRSSRVDRLYEDKYNNIWVLSYDNRAYRFNVDTESFMGTNSVEAYKNKNYYVSEIISTGSGKVWLLSEKEGCISIIDSMFNAEVYSTRDHNLTGDFVHTIHEDMHRNSWILTDKGLTFLPADGGGTLFYFHALSDSRLKEEMPFFSVMESGNELWFGSSEGVVWVYDQDRDAFEELSTGLASDIISIQEISSEKILILSNRSGFVIYTTHDGSMDVYNHKTLPVMLFDEIVTAYIDSSKNIWLETDRQGVSKFNPYTGKYIHFTPYVESAVTSVFRPNFFIFEDRENRAWVHPRGGGFSLYDKAEDKLIPFYNEPSSPRSLFSNMLHSAYSDRQGNLWMCTRSPGLEKVIFYDDSNFKALSISDQDNSTISNEVRPIYEDSHGSIWVATKDGKTHVYDAGLNEKGILTQQGEIGRGTPLNGIAYCITEDSEQNIWIGTKGEGVYKLIRRKDGNSFAVHHFRNDPSDKYSLNSNDVYSIFEDKNKNIWIGTYGGGLNLILSSDEGRIINHLNDLTRFPINHADRVRIISEDKHGNICVGTTFGFIMFDAGFEKPQDIDFKVYTRNNSNSGGISANDIMDICTTQSGETFIGTFGGGITRIDSTDHKGFPVTFETYNTIAGLPSDIILSIQEDSNGHLWIGSEGGLTKFNRDKQTFENFSAVKRLMKRTNFSENSRWRLQDGRMIFGSLEGIVVFDPRDVKNNTFNPYLALVQFKLFNRSVPVSPDGLLKQNIDESNHLILRHNQNFIGIDFAALDYIDPENILYMYKMEGVDKEWIFSGNQRSANYTNIPKGKYLFRVKSTNSDGVWADNERLLSLEVLPPFWATGWAYLVYMLVAILLLYATFKILYTFYKMRNKIVLEKRESEIKTRFFTNISHEIRTPLTMIVSPIDNLLQSKNTPETVRSQLKLISKNTNRLLKMVNQILDFQKMEQSQLVVNKIEIASFVENIYMNYVRNAEIKKIDYSFVNKVGAQMIWIDTEAVEKIIVNLLSNAFKYTPPGRAIQVSVYNENSEVAVRIKDMGGGISKDKQERLFKRFESFNEDPSKPSTGIGLSIVKEMVDKHHGRVLVESGEGRGSTFTVLFKKGTSHFGSDVIIDHAVKPSSPSPDEMEETAIAERESMPTYEELSDNPCVLVVEDDDDLRQFIRSILEDEYEVHEASNGKEGFEKALELIPDFIVSDIMMPEIDGIEFLGNIRDNALTSHILFLLLTAKTTLDSKLEGFQHGADEYITKPFSVSYFKARMKNLLQRRSELQKYYRNKTNMTPQIPLKEKSGDNTASVNEKDIDFIRTVNSFIEKHLGENDFVIEDMAVEAAMSRTVFFKKLKGLTGLAPVEYVRDYLMQHAAELLENEDYTIKEVAYRIGMNDAKYFTKCFKKKYNMTPSEYKTTYGIHVRLEQ
ncbi:MAG: two-component regulator propeller domain-containing protein [Proteiniphilum sp.]|jgi:signal transduction histidine kinase/ligand-binding sensor domain-containing protein/DNA-binding response OmpR family regulator|uniref:hybrid sensor histidine kinase/response regulator transcription factor n=1 Tax=Proteiniphilum sp. TaxID=1926877 RepID=UPI002B1EA9E9|nr:two-component regulator propeller domain-containing protein [Proteiniphilum sp.]MEA5128488.1 two-component regulator propeller domain-containing protein [Proteiniphilum sp.]